MGAIIGMLVGKQIFGQVIGEKAARFIAIGGLILALVLMMGAAKCAYDRNVIKKHVAEQEAATAKADRKADNTAAKQRVEDVTRANTEAQEIKEAINEAGTDPNARRRAYYECVVRQQEARRKHQPPAEC